MEENIKNPYERYYQNIYVTKGPIKKQLCIWVTDENETIYFSQKSGCRTMYFENNRELIAFVQRRISDGYLIG